jgi:hypothetical protein
MMELQFIKNTVLKQYHFNLKYAEKLVDDIPENLMTKSGGDGLENHPAFTLGHLATASSMTVEDLGGLYKVPEGWKQLFQRKGPGDPRKPDPDVALYPSKNILLEELNIQHERVIEQFKNAPEFFLLNNCKWRFEKYFPSVLDLVVFMCLSHECMHLSQLSAWRRAMKFSSALAEL